VVLEFVNAHGGTIEIVDGEFPGAHFRIRMPVLSVTNPVRTQAHAA
jgi:signal transduction histidine kinase